MIYLEFPLGGSHGWGICGKYVARELAAMTPTRLITEPFTPQSVGDEMEAWALARLLPSPDEVAEMNRSVDGVLPGPLLAAIPGKTFVPYRPNVKSHFTVGYCFFEENLLPRQSIENAHRYYNIVTTGSTWCTDCLRSYGVKNPKTVIQGIDPAIFHPGAYPREFFQDKFVVFSGGKIEFRKGQDLVIRAYKVLQDRHKDVVLVNAWYNIWQFSLDTIRASPLIRFNPRSNEYIPMINEVLEDNGIDITRVVTLGPRPNASMARIYHNTDVGLFPNRCEGGTNLVLMEYMACAKPVIATNSSGHRDIVTPENALLVNDMKSITMRSGPNDVATWDDPNLDEVISQLEFAYQNRDRLNRIATRAGEDLGKLTWRKTAEHFHRLLTGDSPESPATK